LDAYPLLKQTYSIAFGGAEPASVITGLRSDGMKLGEACSEKASSPFILNFSGRIALVTGAASGIGRCIATCLAGHGAEVVAVDRNEADLKSLAEEVPLCKPLPCDLSDTSAMQSMVAEAGKVDLLVNAAGIAVFQTFGEQEVDIWDKTMDINARPVWFLTQEIGKGMAERGFGSIVNISSQSSSVVVSDRHLAYSTSKAAVDHITRMASYALAKSNVRVNAVNPTVVRTELAIKAHGEEGLKKMAAKVPLGRVCEPQDVADTVLYLLSDRARMITGVTLPVDGGFVVSRP
jgi:NAD(P)-dependent dehydrogenase (short-subunit alcohol dehydrogenase family)